jgi:hypothetical protein
MSQYPKLYATAAWKRARDSQLKHYPLCRFCLDMGETKPATVADHVIPHRGDPYLFHQGELQSLCKLCHDSHKQRQEKSGLLIGGDTKGFPVDPAHHWHRGEIQK